MPVFAQLFARVFSRLALVTRVCVGFLLAELHVLFMSVEIGSSDYFAFGFTTLQ